MIKVSENIGIEMTKVADKFFSKHKKVYYLDENGNKIINFTDGEGLKKAVEYFKIKIIFYIFNRIFLFGFCYFY